MALLTTRRVAAVAMLGIAAIHLALAPEYFGQQPYIGVLFVLGALAGAFVSLRLWRGSEVPVWILGVVVAAGMGVGFVLSRTVGLPGFHESEWEASGLLSLALEGIFLATAANAVRTGSGELVADRQSA
jgi:hypothetical protein